MYRVEYIKNVGATQYINTQFYANQDTRVVLHLRNTGSCAYWFGAWNVAYNNGAYACCNDYTEIYSGYDGQGGGSGNKISGSNVIDMDKNVIKINNNTFRTFNYNTFSLFYPLYIFMQNRSGTAAIRDEWARQYSECEISAIEIYDNGTLVREYVAAYDDTTGEIGLYDKCAGQLYTNAGSGTFERGAILERLETTKKYLIRDEAENIYTIANEELTVINESISATTFATYGTENRPEWEQINALVNPEILLYMSEGEKLIIATQTATPPPQTLISADYDLTDETILGIEDADIVASDDVLFAISFDMGETWKAYNGSAWITLTSQDSGMSATTFNSAGLEEWAAVVGSAEQFRIRAILPELTSYIESVIINFIN